MVMDELIGNLINVMNEENKIYDELLRLSGDKTDIIVKGKVSELDSMVSIEQALIVKLGELEGHREGIVDDIAVQLGVKTSELTVSELVKRIGEDRTRELQKCQTKLSGTLNNLKELNDINSKLVKNSLEFIDFSVNMLVGAPDPGNNYGYNGQVNDPQKRNLFDKKL